MPLEPGPALTSIAARAVPGVEEVDAAAGTVRRLVDLGAGPVPVTAHVTTAGVEVHLDGPGRPRAGDHLAAADPVALQAVLRVPHGRARVVAVAGVRRDAPVVGGGVRGLRTTTVPA